MSWDVSMTADVGAIYCLSLGGYEQNVTYNLSAIFQKAFIRDWKDGFEELDGKSGKEAYCSIENALICIRNNIEDYRKLEPSNKWGTVETAIKVLETLLRWCHEAPKGILKIS